jgi:probable rRNA maturation factor
MILMKIKIALDKPAHLRSQPTKAGLEKLFLLAWKALPPSKRKIRAASNFTDLCVDLHAVSDAEIAGFNRRHMQHQGATDVLSFPLLEDDPERRAFMLGEIIYSYETAQREAHARKLRIEEECCRYCVHGLLHLLGYEDTTAAQAKLMHALQEKIIAMEFGLKK